MSKAVLGTFSEVKILKTRSVLQIIVEVPIENADEALKALGGVPQPGTERWVGVALAPKEREAVKPDNPQAILDHKILPGEADRLMPKDRRPFNSLPLSQQAGIRCLDEQFIDFVADTIANKHMDECGHMDNPADFVRWNCGVTSRSELDTNDQAGIKWLRLENSFQDYLTDLRYAGTARG